MLARRKKRENIFRKIEVYDIIQKQLEVAKTQIQVGGRIHKKDGILLSKGG